MTFLIDTEDRDHRDPVAGTWLTGAVVYQVYPRSFMDSDGDGVGDLRGVTSRLGYLEDLGVDAVWLSPFFPSPMRDFGYDVSDYTGVDPLFGNLDDFDELLAQAHARRIKVLIDFVPNHTSDEHPWFRSSRASRDAAHGDWYVWADPSADGGPPNNWRSVTGGPAWRFEPARGQYVLHSFLPFQPDLDLRAPGVQEALHSAMRFWLDRGVDGLRVDMVDFLAKDPLLRDEPDSCYRFVDAVHHLDREGLAEVLEGLMAVVCEYDDRVLVGEINPESSIARTVELYGTEAAPWMHLPFNFGLMRQPFEASALRTFIDAYDRAVPQHGWPNLTLGNHDVSRLASRLGPADARLAAVLLLTVRGSAFLYYGDELGLTDVAIPADQVQDPWEAREPGRGRDGARTPMPWRHRETSAGFSGAVPWLPIGSENAGRAVDDQLIDGTSLLNLYRDLLTLRRTRPVLGTGAQVVLDVPAPLLCWERSADGDSVLVVLNFADRPTLVPRSVVAGREQVLLSSGKPTLVEDGALLLPARAGAVLAHHR